MTCRNVQHLSSLSPAGATGRGAGIYCPGTSRRRFMAIFQDAESSWEGYGLAPGTYGCPICHQVTFSPVRLGCP